MHAGESRPVRAHADRCHHLPVAWMARPSPKPTRVPPSRTVAYRMRGRAAVFSTDAGVRAIADIAIYHAPHY
jgi:hypothetical protein